MKKAVVRFSGLVVGLIASAVLCMGCGKSASNSSNAAVDSSASGSVASAVGGAYNGGSGSGTQAFLFETAPVHSWSFADLFSFVGDAVASVACPTIPGSASGCSVIGPTATLTYSDCSFPGALAVWSGSQSVTFTGASPTCGSAFPAGTTQIQRTFGSGTTRTSAFGLVVNVDTAGVIIAADHNPYSGGATVSISSGVRTQIAISGVNLSSSLFSHSITTSPIGSGATPLAITGDNTISSGSVTVFHNLLKIKGTSTLTNVGFSAGCCLPTSGSITTAFSAIAGVTPTNAGSLLVGSSETLTFSGCGAGIYTGPDGVAGAVTLAHCI